MQALDYWKAVTADRSQFLDRVVELLESSGAAFCLVGGQAVNAYVEPVVSLDLDLAVAAPDLERTERLFDEHFLVERFPDSVKVSAPGSDLRVQLQTDPRYASFPERAERREVLGLTLPVARLEDVVQGKVWAALDPNRRASKRQKDLADLARLLEGYPHLRGSVPQELLDRLL
ncbi:MAG TPA: nucleotidyl transferase AbiEii/AbiGii toxin family protein [Thermoanaerobaculia bacterium]|nr:nucleotidyl transferase AbiEii/AbiGii toxin family protein [Thermoanaerobaculia bacterium]